MYTANDIRNARFPTQMKGYKQEEVDIFLDAVENDYVEFQKTITELNNQITALKKESDELRISQSGIQNVLISAQKLADQIVEEARLKAEEIIVEAKVRANELSQSVDAQIANDKLVADQQKQKAEAAELEREKKMQRAMITLKKKYGKNAIIKGMNLEEGATAMDRNRQIGGHKA
jgi:DivIVA domain-containing protein